MIDLDVVFAEDKDERYQNLFLPNTHDRKVCALIVGRLDGLPTRRGGDGL